jgi:hypothetical protein
MTEVHSITYSEMAAWDHCEKKWWFGYDQLLATKAPIPALNIGSATHNGIELFYGNPQLSSEEVIAKTLEEYDREKIRFESDGGYPTYPEICEKEKKLIKSMLHEYIKETNKIDNFELISLEEEFNIPIINPYTKEVREDLRLMGKIDGWCRVNGYEFLLEHKTAAMAVGDWWWKYLTQLYTYMYAFQRKHNITAAGAFVNLLLKKIPSKPKFLKNGTISKQSISTTEEKLLEAILEEGKDPNDFKEEFERVKQSGNPFIRRKAIYTRQDELNEIELKIWHAIHKKINSTYYSRNRSDLCSRMCSFKVVCNHDTDEIRKELYTTKQKRYSELDGIITDDGS